MRRRPAARRSNLLRTWAWCPGPGQRCREWIGNRSGPEERLKQLLRWPRSTRPERCRRPAMRGMRARGRGRRRGPAGRNRAVRHPPAGPARGTPEAIRSRPAQAVPPARCACPAGRAGRGCCHRRNPRTNAPAICGCTSTRMRSPGTPNRWCASMTSRPLFISEAESTEIFGPIDHFGMGDGLGRRDRGQCVPLPAAERTTGGGEGDPCGHFAGVAGQALEDRVVLAVDRHDGGAMRLRRLHQQGARQHQRFLVGQQQAFAGAGGGEGGRQAGGADDRRDHGVAGDRRRPVPSSASAPACACGVQPGIAQAVAQRGVGGHVGDHRWSGRCAAAQRQQVVHPACRRRARWPASGRDGARPRPARRRRSNRWRRGWQPVACSATPLRTRTTPCRGRTPAMPPARCRRGPARRRGRG